MGHKYIIVYYMNPIICRIGSKRDISDIIIKMIPEHKIYVEPFFGDGTIFFKKSY